MSTTVSYKGSILTTVVNQTKKMLTAGKYMEDDVTITDISSGSCDPIVQDQDGFLVLDEFCDNIGEVYQDEDGFIVFGSPIVGGLEYETGTWTPSEDVASYVIPFSNLHTEAPFFYMVYDSTGTPNPSYPINIETVYVDHYMLTQTGIPYNSNANGYSDVFTRTRVSSSTTNNNSAVIVTYSSSDSGDSSSSYARYWATETGIKAYCNNGDRYWKTGCTYKWIAVWAPKS